MKNNILNLYNNNDIQKLVKEYLCSNSTNASQISDFFEKSVKDLTTKLFYIPVLGTQGSGKTSFLNSVLFNDIILPVDADETTCIPTEIYYENTSSPKAKIVFLDKTIKDIDCRREIIAEYVHQEFNPGNIKKVDVIKITCNHEILKNGVVLVDLPGVGSITKENQERTIQYLKNATGGIFILRTVPPITNSESIFLQLSWPLLSNVFFIQNQWIDESIDEVQDGLEHNQRVLKKIANSAHIPPEKISLDHICIGKALTAKCRDDQETLFNSNLISFVKKLQEFSSKWHPELQNYKTSELKNILSICNTNISQKINILTGDKEEIKKQLKTQLEELKKEFGTKKDKFCECKTFLKEQKKELINLINEKCRTGSENLRNAVREIINGGIVGGSQLETAYLDNVNLITEEISKELQTEILKVNDEALEYISEISNVSMDKVNINDVDSNFEEYSKAHAWYGRVGGLIGSVGGFWGGALAGTAIGGPLGFIVGGAIGILGGLLGNFIGNQAKKVHLNVQKETAREQLFEKVEDLENNIKNKFKSLITDFIKNLITNIKKWLEEQEQQREEKLLQFEKDANKTEETKNKESEILNNDLIKINNLIVDLEEIQNDRI